MRTTRSPYRSVNSSACNGRGEQKRKTTVENKGNGARKANLFCFLSFLLFEDFFVVLISNTYPKTRPFWGRRRGGSSILPGRGLRLRSGDTPHGRLVS